MRTLFKFDNQFFNLKMSKNIMHNTTMVEIIRHHSVSKNKDRFISGDLHATRDDCNDPICGHLACGHYVYALIALDDYHMVL